jgi:hypothetical protein
MAWPFVHDHRLSPMFWARPTNPPRRPHSVECPKPHLDAEQLVHHYNQLLRSHCVGTSTRQHVNKLHPYLDLWVRMYQSREKSEGTEGSEAPRRAVPTCDLPDTARCAGNIVCFVHTEVSCKTCNIPWRAGPRVQGRHDNRRPGLGR